MRPAFDSRANWKVMNTMYSMNPPTPKVRPNPAICASVKPNMGGDLPDQRCPDWSATPSKSR